MISHETFVGRAEQMLKLVPGDLNSICIKNIWIKYPASSHHPPTLNCAHEG